MVHEVIALLHAACCASAFTWGGAEHSHGAVTAIPHASLRASALMRHWSGLPGVGSGLQHADPGSGAASPAIVDLTRQLVTVPSMDAGHVPSAGPLVLLGIAALVGGPRRTGRARPSATS